MEVKQKGSPEGIKLIAKYDALSGMQEFKEPDHILSYVMICIIAMALNEDWVIDWSNYYEWKYNPWFFMGKGLSSGFLFIVANYDYSHSLVGSRLCFKTEELCKYAATNFREIYLEFFTK